MSIQQIVLEILVFVVLPMLVGGLVGFIMGGTK